MAERLIQLLTEKRDFVKGKMDAHQEPTPQQLAQFLSDLTTQVGGLVRFCPEEVVRFVRSGFTSVGWSVKKNKPMSSSPPTTQAVYNFLSTCLEQINAYSTLEHFTVTPEELGNLSLAATKLWDLDYCRLVPGVDYEIDLQQGKKPYETGDRADGPLFKFVSEGLLEREAWSTFYALLDNYERHAGQAEVVTRHEKEEEQAFMNAVFKVPCMKYCHKYLVAKGKAPASEAAFKGIVHQLWFGLYRRVVENDSSGFEHVFVGEEKNGKVTGLHNWIQIYREEREGRLDYLGFIRPKGRGAVGPREHDQLITVQFAWEAEVKDVSSSFIGVSPAFEMALYTLCFLAGEEHNVLQIGPYAAEITCFRMHHHGKDYIGTAFPSAIPFTPDTGAAKIQALYRGKKARS